MTSNPQFMKTRHRRSALGPPLQRFNRVI